MTKLLRFLFLIVGLAAVSSSSLYSAPVKIAGSDLLSGLLKEVFANYGGKVELALGGTLTAERELEAERAKVAVVALPEGRWEGLAGFERLPLLYQVVVIGVHTSNPVESVNYEQLRAIFGVGGRTEQWGHLIGDPAWGTRKINLAAIRQPGNLSLEIFNALVMNGVALRPTITYRGQAQALINMIGDDNQSLAILPHTQSGSAVRLLPVARGAGEQAYPPTADNILFGDYPLRLPFYVIWKTGDSGESGEAVRDVIRHLYSDESAALFSRHGYQPIPERERVNYLSELGD